MKKKDLIGTVEEHEAFLWELENDIRVQKYELTAKFETKIKELEARIGELEDKLVEPMPKTQNFTIHYTSNWTSDPAFVAE